MDKKSTSLVFWLNKPWLLALLLGAITFTLFSPAIGYDFINYDDNLYVFENAHVLHGLSWAGLVYSFQTIDGASWMPVTWFSYMLDASLYGTKPAGYHLTNILLHSASAGLLFFGLYQLTKRTWTALLVAGLFAWHPQRLESVAWIAERKDVLSVFFWMLGLVAYIHYAREPKVHRMLWVIVCLALGIMAKPMVVSFPFAMLLLDFWPLRRLGNSPAELRDKIWPLIKEKIPLLIICALAAAATIWSQNVTGAIRPVHFPWYLKSFQVIENAGFYCRKFFSPTGLTILYPTGKLDYAHLTLVALGLVAISLLALRQAWRWPWVTVGWLWFLLTLAPVIGFFHIGEINVADRYSYLPSVGLAIGTVYSLAEFVARWPRMRSSLIGVLASWILFCALATWADLPRWRNTFTIFESAYRHGRHFIACDQLGSLLYTQQKYQQSLVVCTQGLEENPRFASLYDTRGGDYYMLNDLDKALTDFNQAIAVNPAFSSSYYNRALIHVQRKQYTEARADLKEYLLRGGQLDSSKLNIPAGE